MLLQRTQRHLDVFELEVLAAEVQESRGERREQRLAHLLVARRHLRPLEAVPSLVLAAELADVHVLIGAEPGDPRATGRLRRNGHR